MKRTWMLLLVYALTAVSPLLSSSPAAAGEQAERAIAAVLKLKEEGKLPKDVSLRLALKKNIIYCFWGKAYELKNLWESQTGVLLEESVRPNLPVLEDLRSNKNFDVAVARQREFGDLYTERLILALTPYVKKYAVRLDDNPTDGLFAPRIQTEFAGEIVSIPLDSDIALLYLRKDLLEDPARREQFMKRYGKPLEAPRTWDEYQQLLEFFHDPPQGFFGTVEQRDPQTGWMFWSIRYASQTSPNQYLFDGAMHPLIASPAGIKATEQYLQTIPFSPPGILSMTLDETKPLYLSGKAFSFIITPAAAKIFNGELSPIKGKSLTHLMPGTVVPDGLVRRTAFIYGNNLVIPAGSEHPELAFLYIMWISDPDISAKAAKVEAGCIDPFRYCHLRDGEMRNTYGDSVLDGLSDVVSIAIPDATGLPGDSEYIDALSRNLMLASERKLSPRQCMQKTAAEWEAVTEKYGRDKQAGYWRSFREKYPTRLFPVPDDLNK